MSFFGKGGKIGGTDLKEFKKGLFLEKLNNLVEEWGSSYAGRFLSYLVSQNKSFPFIQIYNITPKDPIAFKKAHDKFISKKNKTIV